MVWLDSASARTSLVPDQSSRNANPKLTCPQSSPTRIELVQGLLPSSKECTVGLLDLFTTKLDVLLPDDLIWLTPEAKLKGIIAQVRGWLDKKRFVLVLAHFPTTLAKVEEGLSATGVPSEVHRRRLSRKDVAGLVDQAGQRKVLLVQAGSLPCDEFPMEINDTLEGLVIPVAERHFVREKDDAIFSFGRTLGRPCELVFHLSLHDPLMKQFSGDWLYNVLHRLGMGESKAIEGKMVARQIKSAQANLSSGLLSDRPANSAEEWLRLNVPDMAVFS